MRSSGKSRRLRSADTYEMCIDIMVDSQRTIDKIDLVIRQLEDQKIDRYEPGYMIGVNDLKNHHCNLVALKVFISEYLQEHIENSKQVCSRSVHASLPASHMH